MSYEWEKNLAPYTTEENLVKLRELVNSKVRRGRITKWVAVGVDFIAIALLVLFIVGLDLFKMKIDPRVSLANGVIAFELAVVTFFSPINGSSIKKREVDSVIGKEVTADIMEPVRKTVEKRTSGIQKWLALIGACGVLAAVVLKVIN